MVCGWVLFCTGGDLLDYQGLIPFAVLGRLDRVIVLQGETSMKRSMESRKELVRVVLLLATVVGHIFPEERGLRDAHLAEQYVSQHIIPERDPRVEVLDNPHPPVTELGDLGRRVPLPFHHDEVLDAIVGTQVVVQLELVEQ